MELRKMVSTTVDAVVTTAHAVGRFAKLERVLVSVCLLIPAFLILFDAGPVRESISAYYICAVGFLQATPW